MAPRSAALHRSWLAPALRGLQAGMLAGLAVILWYCVTSWIRVRFPLEKLEDLAVAFYRIPYSSGRAWPVALSGAAAQLTASGLAGALFGFVAQRLRGRRRVLLVALLMSLGWYYAWGLVLAAGTSATFLQGATVLIGHILYGFLLAALFNALAEPTAASSGGSAEMPDQSAEG